MLLADVAVLRLDRLAVIRIVFDLALRKLGRRKHVGRVEHRLPPERSDPGHGEQLVVAGHAARLAQARRGLDHSPPCRVVGMVDLARGGDESFALFRLQSGEQPAAMIPSSTSVATRRRSDPWARLPMSVREPIRIANSASRR